MSAIKTTVNDALSDMLEMLKAEAQTGAKDAAALLEVATRLTTGAMRLTGNDQLQALESIGLGVANGLAAIANERKRAIFQNIIQSTLGFASNILKMGLGILGRA